MSPSAESATGGIITGGQAVPVTLDYPGSGHQDPEVVGIRYPVPGSAGPVRGFGEPHNSAARRQIPQESHGRNGTLRYTCYAC
jgi:hypothetical protein